jgi:dolichyl-phosphate-mannose-protein mannosyltransferase
MMRKLLLVVIILGFLLIPFSVYAQSESQIDKGDCEDIEDVELEWEVTVGDENRPHEISLISEDDNQFLVLHSASENYLSLKQPLFFKANTTYEIGATVKYKNIDNDKFGGYLRLENAQAKSNNLMGTNENWQHVKFFVTTLGSDVYTGLEIALGEFDSHSRGTLFIDDVYAIEVANVAHEGQMNIVDEKEQPEQVMPETIETVKIEKMLSDNQKVSLVMILFCLVIFMMAITWFSLEKRTIVSHDFFSDKRMVIYLSIGIVFIVAYKYVVASLGTDLPSDVGYFTYWADNLANVSFRYFYQNTNANYPAGYMYVLFLVGKLANLFKLSFDSVGFNLLLKTPVIIFEVLTSLLAFVIARKYLGKINAVIFALIVLINPANLINTSAWCQVDAVFIFFVVLTIYLLQEKKYYFAAAAFAGCMLVKTQAIFFLPVIGMVYILNFFKDKNWKKSLRIISISLGIMFSIYLVLSLPLRGDNGFFFAFKNFVSSVSTYDYVSMNGFNFYTLFGANYALFSEKFVIFSYQTWGYIFIVLFSLLTVYTSYKNKDKKALFLIASILMAGIFTFGHGMHERYIVPLPVLLMFAYCYQKDRRILNAAILYTVFSLLNQVAVLFFFGVSFYKAIEIILSIFSLVCFGYLAYIGYVMLIKAGAIIKSVPTQRQEEQRIKEQMAGKRSVKIAKRKPVFNLHKKYEPTRVTKHDRTLILAMTLVYALIAFINLGSMKIPKSSFEPFEDNHSLIVEFEEESKVSQIKYYFGLGQTIVDLEISNDGQSYNSIAGDTYDGGFFNIDHGVGEMFKWKFIESPFEARFVKVTFRNKDIDVREMAFINEVGELITINSVLDLDHGTDSNYKGLTDEQNRVSDVVSYKQGMYFDEIYHARTALEHIEGITPYEITHPPLGKSIISLGIRIFGMNPFGWRFMGTLFGVFMIPLLYMFAKKLFNRTYLAFIATFLLMFDFMHFTQTRMATIDSFSVFFIILMFYYMYDYFKMNFNNQKLSETLIPLGLCGFAFGLGAATKWICLYAGVGLALIFAYSMFQRFREYFAAKLIIKDKKASNLVYYQGVVDKFSTNFLLTLLFCILFFIIVPLIIYYLSYIPYMRGEGGYTFKMILENQTYMFNYHSTLDTAASPHPFSSKWYSWIFNIRPVYLYQGQGYADNVLASLSTFGNPFIWWALYPSIIVLLIAKYNDQKYHGALGFVIVAGLAELVPWMFISRETYIYHYFGTLPFVILVIAFACKYIWERTKRGKYFILGYLVICMIAFALFYPVITGVPVARGYGEWLRWLDTWPFY